MPAADAEIKARRIVIVEDNMDVRDLLRLNLKRIGHEVHAVDRGDAGVEAVIDKCRAIESGFDAHLTKPAEMSDIENILSRFPRRA